MAGLAEFDSLTGALRHQAAVRGDKVAFRFLNKSAAEIQAVTFAGLLRQAQSIAAGLIARGHGGERVLILQQSGEDFVASFFGVLFAGGAAIPVNPRLTPRTLAVVQGIFENSRAAAVLTDGPTKSKLAQAALSAAELRNAPVYDVCDVKMDADAEGISGRRDPGALAVLQYTSGSTSSPKGVQITDANFLANFDLLSGVLRTTDDEVAVTWLPLFHDMGLMLGIVAPVLAGASCIMMQTEAFSAQPVNWLKVLSRYRGTVSSAPNFAYQACIDGITDEDLEGLDLSSWRVAMTGAEPVLASTTEQFASRFARAGFRPEALMPSYGLAEATLFVSGGPANGGMRARDVDRLALEQDGVVRPAPSADQGRRLVSSGGIYQAQEVVIADPAAKTERPELAVGEIWIRGPSVSRGYFGQSDANADVFDAALADGRGGFMRTGDLGFVAERELFVVGRLKDVIIVRGVNHYPQDIEETAAASHPALQPAGVAAFSLKGEQEANLAIVAEMRHGHESAAPAALRDIRQAILRSHGLWPSTIALVRQGQLPRTSSGKIRRSVAREDLAADRLRMIDKWTADANSASRPELRTTALEEQIRNVWQTVLGHAGVSVDVNFFDLGGDSVQLAAVQDALSAALGRSFEITEFFEYPTIRAFARYIGQGSDLAAVHEGRRRGGRRLRCASGDAHSADLAIIGMAGRFPDAPNVATFWENLCSGREAVKTLSDVELAAAGVSRDRLSDRNYVKAAAPLADADCFDADYFNVNAPEAEALDPQHRIILECAVEALEDAGTALRQSGDNIGVYVGSSVHPKHLALMPDDIADADPVARWLTVLGSDKDYLATRLAYKLNLSGPAVVVQSACSTSLVAVHLACQALLAGECDAAVAGAVSAVNSIAPVGYRFSEGDILSADGHCRPFDADAAGTVFGDGVGLVVLKRLDRALADGDHIRAIIKGTAINNDGADKVGFTAPSVAGQAAVIAEALATAGVEADTIGYVEAHGTGTPIGDPIEIAALKMAFCTSGEPHGACAIGSVKANIGHLNVAAGMAGLIKLVLSLENGKLPPQINYSTPNPAIDFAKSPFFVNTELRDWNPPRLPRRGAVSSFGIGGTNAHVIVEEAPRSAPVRSARTRHALLVSAKTSQALEQSTDNLARHLRSNPDQDIADIAYTLAAGRASHAHARVILCGTLEEAADAAEKRDARRVRPGLRNSEPLPVAFMFPGQGAQHLAMGRNVYRTEPVFRRAFDSCAEHLKRDLQLDLRSLIFDSDPGDDAAAARLKLTGIAQPALFSLSYALAQQWISWGVNPSAMIGHSVGEWAAACLAGVFSLEDALDLVAARGRLMQSLPAGAMLAVAASARALEPFLSPEISIAAINGPSACVLSGPADAIALLERELASNGSAAVRLDTFQAFHSNLMDPAVGPFTALVAQRMPRPPSIPFVSSVTGDWITAGEASSPQYWGRQLRETVRFCDGIGTLLASHRGVFLEVGPGNTLSNLVGRQIPADAPRPISTLHDRRSRSAADEAMLEAAARVWSAGAAIDWKAPYDGERRRLVPLPSYPFARRKIHRGSAAARVNNADADAAHGPGVGYYVPSWKRLSPSAMPRAGDVRVAGTWLVVSAKHRFTDAIADRLRRSGAEVVAVPSGPGPTVAAGDRAPELSELLREFERQGRALDGVVYASAMPLGIGREEPAEQGLERCFYDLLDLIKAVGQRHSGKHRLSFVVLAAETQSVFGDETIEPIGASALGPSMALPKEWANVSSRYVDVALRDVMGPDADALAERIVSDLAFEIDGAVIAYRGAARWVPHMEAAAPSAAQASRSLLRPCGTYLITGGLGGLGLATARVLARSVQANLVLLSRTGLPAQVDENEPRHARIIREIREIERAGGQVLTCAADVANIDDMRCAVEAAREKFGDIDGVFHAAGTALIEPLLELSRDGANRVLAPKVLGTQVLREVFDGKELDFLFLFSSVSGLMGHFGQSAYSSANAYLDAFARRREASCFRRVISVNWDAWREIGIAADLDVGGKLTQIKSARLHTALSTEEGIEAMLRILGSEFSQVVVARPEALRPAQANARALEQAVPAARLRHPRPDLAAPFVVPNTELEKSLARIVCDVLSVEEVGIDDSFFELGGHSLLGTQVVARLKEDLGVLIPIRALFEYQTIRELGSVIEQQTWDVIEV